MGQLVGRMPQTDQRAKIRARPPGCQRHFVQQHAQEAIEFAQSVADDLRTIAADDRGAARSAQARPEEARRRDERVMRLFDADGPGVGDVGALLDIAARSLPACRRRGEYFSFSMLARLHG
jgi:hypothetical protein